MYYLLHFGLYSRNIIPSAFSLMLKKCVYKYDNWSQVGFITKKNENIFGLERKCLELNLRDMDILILTLLFNIMIKT